MSELNIIIIPERDALRYKYTDEDIEFLREHYPDSHWDMIEQRFPLCTRSGIHSKCNKIGIKSNFNKERVIQPEVKNKWTDDEVKILLDNYSYVPMEKMLELLPRRDVTSITNKATRVGIVSYNKIHTSWTNEEINYIKDNWELTPDEIMAKKLGRTFRAVKYMREELGLYRISGDSSSYENISKYLRGQIQCWKNDSMRNCNFECVLTGSKNYQIHHLYGFSNILRDILNEHPELDKPYEKFSCNELEQLTELTIKKHYEHPLGVCVDKEIHKIFHKMYGQYYNTPEQWYKFCEDYNMGLYKDYV